MFDSFLNLLQMLRDTDRGLYALVVVTVMVTMGTSLSFLADLAIGRARRWIIRQPR